MRISRAGHAVSSVAALAVMFTPTLALADSASQMTYINGMDAGAAEGELRNRGFAFVDSHNSGGSYVNSYWWDSGDDDCVVVEQTGGRVMTVNDASDQDCGHHEGTAGAVALGVAGAAILGALLTHRGGHHDNNEHSTDTASEQDFERGYNDGLHNGPYHNSDRSDAYASGYSAGVDERGANLRNHSGRGGYTEMARIDDLSGARAAGAMDTMEQRGFTQVDNFTSGNTRYSIQWRSSSNQCVQMTIADGHIYDIRDIGSHPGCR